MVGLTTPEMQLISCFQIRENNKDIIKCIRNLIEQRVSKPTLVDKYITTQITDHISENWKIVK